MRRKLPAILRVLSLLLCVATVALWARSNWRVEYAELRAGTGGCRLWSSSGVLVLHAFALQGDERTHYWCYDSAPHGSIGPFIALPPGAIKVAWEDWGATSGMFDTAVFVPHWFVALLATVFPTVSLARRRRQRSRAAAGRCLSCGYDLRQSPARCPECGTPSRGVA